MTQKTLFLIDKGYSVLEKLTDEERAKGLFEKFLLNEKIEDDFDNVKLNIAFKELNKEKIAASIAKHALVYACNETEAPLNEYFVEFKNKLIESDVKSNEVVNYLINNKELYRNVIKAFEAQRYDKKMGYRMLSNVKETKVKQYLCFLEQDEKATISIFDRISNFKLNASKMDVIRNKQDKINHKFYSLGKELFASIDRGNESLAQEDSVLIETHPGLKDFKIIAVADGYSSASFGELASNYSLRTLLEWFDGLNVKSYEFMDDLQIKLEEKLKEISFKLECDGFKSAASIGCAIVGKEKTLISSIGDTRVYLIKSGRIAKETKDDSYVQKLCDEGLLIPECRRFHKAKNYLNELLGFTNDEQVFKDKTFTIDNDEYDKLLILSDGVTRVVGNEKLEQVITAHRIENITERLVDLAKYVDDHLENPLPFCDSVSKAGEENATAAMYVKRR